jgi:hypothetical protein
VAAVVETDELRTALTRQAPAAVALLGVWTIETGGLDDLASLGVDVDDARLDKRRSYVRSEDPATLVYTSVRLRNPVAAC